VTIPEDISEKIDRIIPALEKGERERSEQGDF
jgi:hypothetical protein